MSEKIDKNAEILEIDTADLAQISGGGSSSAPVVPDIVPTKAL